MYIVGHRGASGLAPENTLTSILKALECEVDAIELDARVTHDDIPILHRAPAIARPRGRPLRIADTTLKDLRAAWPDLDTLEAAIRAIDRQVPLILSVTRGVPVDPIVSLIKNFLSEGWQIHDFAFASRDQKTLRALHAALTGVQLIVVEPWSGVRAGIRARQLNTKHISMNQHFLWFYFIRAMHKSRYHLYAYTLNDPKKAQQWAKYGLYAAVTDTPDRFL